MAGVEDFTPLGATELGQVATDLRRGVDVKDRRYRLRLYKNTFLGSEAVDWLVESGYAGSREEAVSVGQQLMESGYFHHVCDDHDFDDKYLFFRFFSDESAAHESKFRGPKASPASSGKGPVLPASVGGDAGKAGASRLPLPAATTVSDELSGGASGEVVATAGVRHSGSSASSAANTQSPAPSSPAVAASGANSTASVASAGSGPARGPTLTPQQKLLALAQRLRSELDIRDRCHRLRRYDNVFVGCDAVDWMVETRMVPNREAGTSLGQSMLNAGLFHHVVNQHTFEDSMLYYRFYPDEDKGYERFWQRTRRSQRWKLRWRVQPHTSCNSATLRLAIADAMHMSANREDARMLGRYVAAARRLAVGGVVEAERGRGSAGDEWKVSPARCFEGVQVWKQELPAARPGSELQHPAFVTRMHLPLRQRDAAAFVANANLRRRWDPLYEDSEAVEGVRAIVPGTWWVPVGQRFSFMARTISTDRGQAPVGSPPCHAAAAAAAGHAAAPAAAHAKAGDNGQGAGGKEEGGEEVEEEEEEGDEELLHEAFQRLLSGSTWLRGMFQAGSSPKKSTKRTTTSGSTVSSGAGVAAAAARQLSAAAREPLGASMPQGMTEAELAALGTTLGEFPRIVRRTSKKPGVLASQRDFVVMEDAAWLPWPPAIGAVAARREVEEAERASGAAPTSTAGSRALLLMSFSAQHAQQPRTRGFVRAEALADCFLVVPGTVRSLAQLVGAEPVPDVGGASTVYRLGQFDMGAKSFGSSFLQTAAADMCTVRAARALLHTAATTARSEVSEAPVSLDLAALSPSALPAAPAGGPGQGGEDTLAPLPRMGRRGARATSVPDDDDDDDDDGSTPAGAVSAVPVAGAGGASGLRRTMSIQDLDVVAVLGRGGYGKVMLVRDKETRAAFAMKVFKKKHLVQRGQVRRTLTERDIMSSVNHPFIVGLKFAFQTDRKLYMGMEFVGGGDFFTLLSRHGLVTEQRARLYMAEIILALEHLHGIGVVYRDLKPENVLLDDEGHVKLTDFGLSRFSEKRPPVLIPAGARQVAAGDDARPVDHGRDESANDVSYSFCGTEVYMAPEQLLQKGHSASADWWSLGILFSEMLTGRHPFRGDTHYDTLRNIVHPAVPPATAASLSPAAASLLRALLQKDPSKRLGDAAAGGLQTLKAHRFLAGVDWDAVMARRTQPQYVPRVRTGGDVSNFDQVFTREAPIDSVASAVPTGGDGEEGGSSFFGMFGEGGEGETAAWNFPSFDFVADSLQRRR